jgi:hypothetical protein
MYNSTEYSRYEVAHRYVSYLFWVILISALFAIHTLSCTSTLIVFVILFVFTFVKNYLLVKSYDRRDLDRMDNFYFLTPESIILNVILYEAVFKNGIGCIDFLPDALKTQPVMFFLFASIISPVVTIILPKRMRENSLRKNNNELIISEITEYLNKSVRIDTSDPNEIQKRILNIMLYSHYDKQKTNYKDWILPILTGIGTEILLTVLGIKK